MLIPLRVYFTLLGGIMVLILPSIQQSKVIKYSQLPTIPFEWEDLQADTIFIQDTASNNVLFQIRTLDDKPLFYAQDIVTEVCFDNKCRLLNITVLWNITGRYFGFELANGEFLSKKEHEAFSEIEYEKLNGLLADPSLPMGDITFEQLIKVPENSEDSVDGISGATTTDVSKMVVQGAAYTTFSLWNIVYGSTQDLVSTYTEKELTPNLLAMILASPDIGDNIWAMNRIDQTKVLSPKVANLLLGLIDSDDFYVSYAAINAIGSTHLNSDTLQINLFSIFENAKHSIKTMIVEKLLHAPKLSEEVITSSRKLLAELNGKQLGDFLKLYEHHAVYDEETLAAVGKILKSKNSYISRQAYEFLKESPLSESEIEKMRNK